VGGAPRPKPTPAAAGHGDVVLDVLHDLRQAPVGGDLLDSAGAPHAL
jgi:hypothetical protein